MGWHLVCLLLPDIANKAGRRREDASVTTSSGWVSRNRAQPGEDRRPNTHTTPAPTKEEQFVTKTTSSFCLFFFSSSMWIPFCVGFHPLALPQDPSSNRKTLWTFFAIRCVRFSRHAEQINAKETIDGQSAQMTMTLDRQFNRFLFLK